MFTKLVVLLVILFAVWMGFKYIGRLHRVEKGQRKPVERTFSERMKRATRGRGDTGSDTDTIEDTEECRVCGAFVSVDAQENCNKANCPY